MSKEITISIVSVIVFFAVYFYREVNWSTGLEIAYHGQGVFISPSLDGCVLRIGLDLVESKRAKDSLALIISLSKEFSEAYYFSTHRIVE